MLAAYFTGKEYLELKEVDKPICPKNGFIVKVHACAICGTDLKVLKNSDVKIKKGKKRSMKLPRIIGHEISGIIEQVGSNVSDYNVGDRVVVLPTVPCNNCYYCQKGYFEMCDNIKVVGYDYDGGFADFIKIDKKIIDGGCILRVPETVNLDEASLTEPLSCAINCFELTPVKKGDTVVVFGGGPLGSFITELAKNKGAKKVVLLEVSARQLDLAKVCPADIFLLNKGEETNEKIFELTEGRGADLVITACPAPAAQIQALEIIAKRGSINFFGGLPRENSIIKIDTNLIHYKECKVVGTHGSTPAQAKEALKMIQNQIDIKKYITSRYKLKNINEAFRASFDRGQLKILIKP